MRFAIFLQRGHARVSLCRQDRRTAGVGSIRCDLDINRNGTTNIFQLLARYQL
jgi:hypothetical protein